MILQLRASKDLLYLSTRGTGPVLAITWFIDDVHRTFAIGLSDGMLILCHRKKGVWHFQAKGNTRGMTKVRHVRAKTEEDGVYSEAPSDLMELDGTFTWAVGGPVYSERSIEV